MSIPHAHILLTGGSGRLGTELRRLLPGVIAPSSAECDITNAESVSCAIDNYQPALIIHAAAYTNVAKAETDRLQCWHVNVDGTRNIAQQAAARGIALVQISTDYVFDGCHGMYREDDPVGPVCNYYALSKLVAEEIVRIVPRHLVIRTSFRPREWPYPVAFRDVYTSQDYIDVIAPDIVLAITRFSDIPYHTLHIATARKSVYDLAKQRKPDVRAGSKCEVSVELPDDISLDISRWQRIKRNWEQL